MASRIIDLDPDYISKLGDKNLLHIGSQLKRISDTLVAQVQELYDKHGKNFKVSWFSFLATIKQYPNSDVKDLAQLRNVSSSAVSQVVKELNREGFVEIKTFKETRSKRFTLTEEGEKALLQISPELKLIEESLKEALGTKHPEFLGSLSKLENYIKEKPLSQRIPSQITIENFQECYANNFKELNLEWFNGNFEVQDYDNEILSKPNEIIIEKGGEIFFALDQREVVGTVAMIKHNNSRIELSKMGVTKSYQGWGIGHLLMEKCISYAKENNYSEILILTHSKLYAAIHLYKKYGFKDHQVSPEDSLKYSNRAELAYILELS